MFCRGPNSPRTQGTLYRADFGYSAAKNQFYHGMKLHVSAQRRPGRLPLPEWLFFTPASCHDLTAAREQLPLRADLVYCADKAYASQQQRRQAQVQGGHWLTLYKAVRGQTLLPAGKGPWRPPRGRGLSRPCACRGVALPVADGANQLSKRDPRAFGSGPEPALLRQTGRRLLFTLRQLSIHAIYAPEQGTISAFVKAGSCFLPIPISAYFPLR